MDKPGLDKPLSIVTTPQEDSIDFVITNSSPGSTFAHLRRSSISANSVTSGSSTSLSTTPARKLDTSMGSAKKVSVGDSRKSTLIISAYFMLTM